MSALYEDSHRRLQQQFDTQRLADRIEQRLFRTALTDEDLDFIEKLDLFFLATVNSRGEPSCSYKGGDPGFVRALDSRTLAFPCYDGNGMYLSMGNVAANGHVGMLFIDLTSPKRLRVNGTAHIAPPESVAPQFAAPSSSWSLRFARCFRTALATYTNTRSSSVPSSCLAKARLRQYLSGSRWTGRATCYHITTQQHGQGCPR